MDKRDGFQIVNKAREMLKSFPEREVSEKTASEYEKTYRYLSKNKIVPELETRSKCTYYKWRAAINYMATKYLKERLQIQDKAQKNRDWETLFEEVKRLSNWIDLLEEYLPQKKMGEGLENGKECPVSNPKQKSSKRKSLQNFQKKFPSLRPRKPGPNKNFSVFC